MYTYQETFGVSTLLPSATSGITTGCSAAPGVPTISNLLIGKFNPDYATGRDAPPLDLDGTTAELDAPLPSPAPGLGQRLGQFLVLGVAADERLNLLARLERL